MTTRATRYDATPCNCCIGPQADPPVAPRSLYTCAARLIAAGLVTLAELRVHLEPMAAQAKASYERWSAELARKTKSYGKVSGNGLSGRGPERGGAKWDRAKWECNWHQNIHHRTRIRFPAVGDHRSASVDWAELSTVEYLEK